MEKKSIKIIPPDGYEIDTDNSTFAEIVFKPIINLLPKTWDELEDISGYYIDSRSEIAKYNGCTKHANRNLFPTREHAVAALALAQLLLLRERYNNGWQPDWNSNSQKYCIFYEYDELKCSYYFNLHTILAFESSVVRDEFYNNFRVLIEIAKPLL